MLKKLFKKGPKDPTYETKDVIKVQAFIRGALCRARVSAMVEKMIEEMLAKKKNAGLDRSSHHSSRSVSARGSSVRNMMAKYEEPPSPSPTKKALPPRKKLAIPNSFLQAKTEESEPEAKEPEQKPEERKPEVKQEVPTEKEAVTVPISKKKTWPPTRNWPPKKEGEEAEEKEEATEKNASKSQVAGKRTWPPPSKWLSPKNVAEKELEEKKSEETQDFPTQEKVDKEEETEKKPQEEKKEPELPAKVVKSNAYVKNIQLTSNATKNVTSSQKVIEEQKVSVYNHVNFSE